MPQQKQEQVLSPNCYACHSQIPESIGDCNQSEFEIEGRLLCKKCIRWRIGLAERRELGGSLPSLASCKGDIKGKCVTSDILGRCHYCRFQRMFEPIKSKSETSTNTSSPEVVFESPVKDGGLGNCSICGSNVNCNASIYGRLCRPCRSFKYSRDRVKQVPSKESCLGADVKGKCQITMENRACSYCRYMKFSEAAKTSQISSAQICTETKPMNNQPPQAEALSTNKLVAKTATELRRTVEAAPIVKERSNNVSRKLVCGICGAANGLVRLQDGLVKCFCCRVFMSKRKKRAGPKLTRSSCIGDKPGNCVITENNRKCTYCRYKKGLALEEALIPPRRPSPASSNSSSNTDLGGESSSTDIYQQQLQVEVVAPPHDNSTCLHQVEDDDDDNIANPRESFCQFFYGDLSRFKPSSSKIKSIDEEVKPKQRKTKKPILGGDLILCRSEAEDTDLGLLSQGPSGLDTEPLETVTTISYSIECEPTRQISESQAEQQDSARNLPKPPTVTVKTHKIIIDRRPLLKKLRRNEELRNSSEEVSSTSLIGPGEDCDDSDDNEIIEIDCDAA